MNFDDIFTAYYTQYRAEATIPSSTDDEYTIGMRLANEAVSRWENFDNTYWKELFTTLLQSGETTPIVTNQVQYDAPEDFKEAGGSIRVLDSSGNIIQRYPIVDPQDTQFRGIRNNYSYFTGSPVEGYVLNINPAPPSLLNGFNIDYDYYKIATLFTTSTDITNMSNPYFIVHRMLANRFRASRNPYYTDALRDAEDALRIMQMENNSGTWSNPWALADRSGSQWGQS